MAFVNLIDNRTNPYLIDGEAQGGGMSGGSYGAGIAGAGMAAGLLGALGGLFGQLGNNNTLANNAQSGTTNQGKTEETETTIPNIKTEEAEITQQPNNTNKEEDKDQDIEDKTNENVEQQLTYESYYDMLKALQEEQWAREDAIRAETQAREDTAYRRAAKDARMAGINLELTGLNPAQSGGGITQATGLNTGLLEKQLDQQTQQMIALIEQGWKGDENDKDRIMDFFTSAMGAAAQIGMAYVLSSAKKKK